MKKFLFLYKGFGQPTPEIGTAWLNWFDQVGESMTDPGNSLGPGLEVTPNGAVELEFGRNALTGYSVIEAESKDAAVELAKLNPMITSVLVYELGSM